MPTSHIDHETVARLRLAMARLARRQRQAASSGLTPSQQSVLAMIDVHGPLPLGELAALEQVAKPTITRIVAKLEDDGLVERLVDTDDRRFARVVVTPIGHERLEETRKRRNLWLTQRIEALPQADIEAIFAVVEPLERLLDVGLATRSTRTAALEPSAALQPNAALEPRGSAEPSGSTELAGSGA